MLTQAGLHVLNALRWASQLNLNDVRQRAPVQKTHVQRMMQKTIGHQGIQSCVKRIKHQWTNGLLVIVQLAWCKHSIKNVSKTSTNMACAANLPSSTFYIFCFRECNMFQGSFRTSKIQLHNSPPSPAQYAWCLVLVV